MNSFERKSVVSLAAIMCLRMIGLFMIIPLFALYAHQLSFATPVLIGLALGVYGLSQGLFQIPLGMLSDKLGRKPIITLGLILFGLGSLLAAFSTSIYTMILARFLQGAGAIGSTVIATIADLTRENQRTKAMAINGMFIGMSFALAMILGPVFANFMHVSGIFILASAFSLLALAILHYIVPTPTKTTWHEDVEPMWASFMGVLKNKQLAILNSGVFFLHAIFTATFVAVPVNLKNFGFLVANQWMLYLPALLIAFGFCIVFIVLAEKYRQLKVFFLVNIFILLCAEIFFALQLSATSLILLSLILFFLAFSSLEAFLPSLVSRFSPPHTKGTAMGVYSSSQFLGIFIGGVSGGWCYANYGLENVYLFCVAFTLVWFFVSINMNNPQNARV